MNRKGFVFTETIVAIVILTSALLLIYTSFNNVLQSEKVRVDYDDVAYIYRTYRIKNVLDKLNIDGVIQDLKNDDNKYFTTIGVETDSLFTVNSGYRNILANLLQDYDVIDQLVILKKDKITKLKECNLKCASSSTCNTSETCNSFFSEITDEMRDYIRTIDIDVKCDNVLAVEYETCKDSEKCYKFFSWVSV